MKRESIREKLAALCHDQWCGWMKYLFGKCEILPNGDKGDLAVIPEWAVQRWRRQMETIYSELPEKEKESDRTEADRFFSMLSDLANTPQSLMGKPADPDAIHNWFGLTYANYLTLPRSVLQSMPGEWQERLVQLLRELDETIDWFPEGGKYWVKLKDRKGRFMEDPFLDYERGRRRIPWVKP